LTILTVRLTAEEERLLSKRSRGAGMGDPRLRISRK
jgi:hypothetical protein